MTKPRSETYDPSKVGTFHCTSRCVRRAFLCGFDAVTNTSFEHRREWIRQRMLFLVDILAIEVIAYAVMSNHLHVLLRTRPDIAKLWSETEVARRWCLLFPLRYENGKPAEPSAEEILAITLNQDRVEMLRARLSDMSWFNRCLKEHIACAANLEDKCTGCFWEGRFKSQRADDLAGILACAAYVDLNPIRAGIALTPESSDFTSIQDRIRAESAKGPGAERLPPPSKMKLLSIEELTENRVTTAEYITLVDLTGRQLRAGKASIPVELAPILKRLKLNPDTWIATSRNLRKQFPQVVGSAEQLRAAAAAAERSWFWGVGSAEAVFLA